MRKVLSTPENHIFLNIIYKRTGKVLLATLRSLLFVEAFSNARWVLRTRSAEKRFLRQSVAFEERFGYHKCWPVFDFNRFLCSSPGRDRLSASWGLFSEKSDHNAYYRLLSSPIIPIKRRSLLEQISSLEIEGWFRSLYKLSFASLLNSPLPAESGFAIS